ncbi:sulfotransferase domain-containing protein [Fragilaria crotonensis]|nr:sulfotransferase domain-containing protein [Fragilaria crotonensis]
MNADDEAGSSPLVSEPEQEHKYRKRIPRRRQIDEGFLFLSASQLVGLFIVAFVVGAFCPMLIFKARDQHRGDDTSAPTEAQIWNNIRNVARNNHANQTSGSSTTHSGVKLAWLMSFPNSGTSYTMSLVSAASNMSMATNYGWESVPDNRSTTHYNYTEPVTPRVPVLASAQSSREGPFWLQPLEKRPHSVVLTKTHCGGYCHGCRPYKSVETPYSFMMHCAMSEADYFNISENKVMSDHFIYEYSEVDRAVHLFRDPFDNMVSRYHLGVHKVTKLNRTDLMARYTYDAAGYNNFCSDNTYVQQEHTEYHVDQDVLRLIEDIPCHFDLFRYIQWHDLAFIVTDDYLGVPTHVIYYEDYSTNFNGTLQALLDFLDLPNTGAYADFVKGKSYRDYFTHDQIARLRTAAMMMASPSTWHAIERYFEGY